MFVQYNSPATRPKACATQHQPNQPAPFQSPSHKVQEGRGVRTSVCTCKRQPTSQQITTSHHHHHHQSQKSAIRKTGIVTKKRKRRGGGEDWLGAKQLRKKNSSNKPGPINREEMVINNRASERNNNAVSTLNSNTALRANAHMHTHTCAPQSQRERGVGASVLHVIIKRGACVFVCDNAGGISGKGSQHARRETLEERTGTIHAAARQGKAMQGGTDGGTRQRG